DLVGELADGPHRAEQGGGLCLVAHGRRVPGGTRRAGTLANLEFTGLNHEGVSSVLALHTEHVARLASAAGDTPLDPLQGAERQVADQPVLLQPFRRDRRRPDRLVLPRVALVENALPEG